MTRLLPRVTTVIIASCLLLVVVAVINSSSFLATVVAASSPLSTPPSNINIAWIHPLNSPSGNAVNLGIPSLFGANLAVQKINNEGQKYRNIVADLMANQGLDQSQAIAQAGPAPLLPWTNLTIVICDTKSDLSTTTACSFDAITKNNAHILVGDASSALTMQISYVANRYGTPVLSISATAVEFSSRANFKNFLRIIGDIGEQTRQMAAVIGKYFQWRKVGIICASDAYGIGGATNFATAGKLAKNNVQVLTTVTFNIGDTDFSFQLQRLIASKTRIIVFVGLQDDLSRLWRYSAAAFASKQIEVDLFSTGFQWILVHSPAVPSLYINTTGGYIEDLMPLIPGTIALQYPWTAPAFQQTSEFVEVANLWDNAPQYLPTGFPGMSIVNPSTTAVGRTFRTSTFISGGVRGYDSVQHIARGAAYAMSLGIDPTSANTTERGYWYNALVQQPLWHAASGEMKLDSVGDRALGFAVLNWKRSSKSWEAMGYMTSNTTTRFDVASNKTVVELEYFLNPNPGSGLSVEEVMEMFEYTGTAPGTIKPLDAPPRELKPLSDSTKQGLISATIIICSVLFIVEVGIVVFRNHIALKAASPLFLFLFVLGVQLLCLSLIGRAYESDPDSSPHQCLSDHWLTNLGYVLLVGSLLVKTIRLQSIFNARILRTTEKRFLSDMMLSLCLGGLLLLESVMLLALQYSTDVGLVRQPLNDDEDYYSCRSTERDSTTGELTKDKLASVYLPTIIAVRFVLLVTTAVYAFLVRNIPDSFNESRQLLVCIYNLLFLSILLPAIDGAMGRGKENSAIAYGICVCVICILSVGIMLVPKFYEVAATALNLSGALKGTGVTTNSDISTKLSNGESSSLQQQQHVNTSKTLAAAGTKNNSTASVQMSPLGIVPFPSSPRSAQEVAQNNQKKFIQAKQSGVSTTSAAPTPITTPALPETPNVDFHHPHQHQHHHQHISQPEQTQQGEFSPLSSLPSSPSQEYREVQTQSIASDPGTVGFIVDPEQPIEIVVAENEQHQI